MLPIKEDIEKSKSSDLRKATSQQLDNNKSKGNDSIGVTKSDDLVRLELDKPFDVHSHLKRHEGIPARHKRLSAQEDYGSIHIDYENRDPYNLNTHVRTQFDEVIGEPEGAYSDREIWEYVNKAFHFGRNCCFVCLTYVCAIPFVFLWGVNFACITFMHIYAITPCFRLCWINCECLSKFISTIIHCICDPLYEAMALLCTKIYINVRSSSDTFAERTYVGSEMYAVAKHYRKFETDHRNSMALPTDHRNSMVSKTDHRHSMASETGHRKSLSLGTDHRKSIGTDNRKPMALQAEELVKPEEPYSSISNSDIILNVEKMIENLPVMEQPETRQSCMTRYYSSESFADDYKERVEWVYDHNERKDST